MRKERGITIIEIVLSIVILFVVFMATAEAFMEAFRHFARIENRIEACRIAQFKMEEEIFKANDDDKHTEVSDCSWTTVPYREQHYRYQIQVENPYDGKSELVKVITTVKWPVTSTGGDIAVKTQEVSLTTICPKDW